MSGTTRHHAETGESEAVDSSLEAGELIGSYRIVSQLGSGGMGEVFLATRDDDQFEKRVAIKVIKRGLDSSEILRRFEAERRILAKLTHPNIAGIHDGGVHTDGRSFVVMELVDGAVPIDEYCRERELDLDQRLELFRVVCGAVEAAHQSLVVHRDLKPSNIVVSDKGEVKLLDFGVAKLLSSESDVSVTRTGQAPMTANCASPEQIRGEAVGTASDIYALGVLLYRLITDEVPYDLKGRSLVEQIELISETEPEKPSAVVRQSRGKRDSNALRGDLDNIVAKAMRKDPAERYSSVGALADDVRRFLDFEPVRARSDGSLYVARKFLRRHRLGVLASIAVVGALGAGVVVATWQAKKAAADRDRARIETQRAERVAALLVDVFESANPLRTEGGGELPIRVVVERGEEQVRRTLADEPRLETEMLAVLARVYISLGMLERGIELTRSTLESRRALFGDRSVEVADGLHDLASALRWKTEAKEAAETAEQALELRREIYGKNHEKTALTLRELGSAIGGFDPDAAWAYFDEALEIQRGLLGDNHKQVADTLAARATLRHYRGDLDDATRDLREALRIRRSEKPVDELAVASLEDSLNATLEKLGGKTVSEESRRKLIATFERRLGKEHPSVIAPLINLGSWFYTRGRYKEAVTELQNALVISQKVHGPDHTRNALILSNIGVIATVAGDGETAVPALRQALALRIKLTEPGHGGIAHVQLNLATALMINDELEEARALLLEALEGSKKVGHDRRVRQVEATLARVALIEGRYDRASELVDIYLATLDDAAKTPTEMRMLLIAADVRLAKGQTKEAERLAKSALDFAMDKLPEGHWQIDYARAYVAAITGAAADLEASRAKLVDEFNDKHWSVLNVDGAASRATKPSGNR